MLCAACRRLLSRGGPRPMNEVILLEIRFAAGEPPRALAKLYDCLTCRTRWEVAVMADETDHLRRREVWRLADSSAA